MLEDGVEPQVPKSGPDLVISSIKRMVPCFLYFIFETLIFIKLSAFNGVAFFLKHLHEVLRN